MKVAQNVVISPISDKQNVIRILFITIFLVALLTIVPPFRDILRHFFPTLSSKTAELEMGIFQTLIGAYTIFVSLLIVAVEVLHPRRLIEVRDLFEDAIVIKGTILFLFFSVLPLLLIASGFFTPETPEHTLFFLMIYLIAAFILIYLIQYIIKLLDPTFFIKMHVKKTLDFVLNLRKLKTIKAQVEFREKYTDQLNRLFDATRISIASIDTNLTRTLIYNFFVIAKTMELDWHLFTRTAKTSKSNQLLQEIVKELELERGDENEEIPYREQKWGKHIMLGEFIWEPLWRIRNIGEMVVTDPFLRPYYNFDLTLMILTSIKSGAYIVAKGLTNCYWKILIESKRNHPEIKRIPEVLSHGIFAICGFLYQKHKMLFSQIAEENVFESSPFTEGRCYVFKHVENPIIDIIIDYFWLIFILDTEILDHITCDTLKEQAKEQLTRKYWQYLTETKPEDVDAFFIFYQSSIKPKFLK